MLLEIPNPNYSKMQRRYAHLDNTIITEHDAKKDLMVHVILETGDNTKLKTKKRYRVGQPGK